MSSRPGRGRRLQAAQGLDQGRVLPADLVATRAVDLRHPAQELAEGRQPVARLRREVGPGEEGHQVVRGQEHRQRPAPGTAREELVGRLVDAVEVRPLLAVDLDVDEQLVHQARGVRVLEGLVRHHVAPVAGRVADREQDGPVLGARAGERLLAPGIPVDGVVGVLQEVGAGLLRESVRAGHGAVAPRWSGKGAGNSAVARSTIRQRAPGVSPSRTGGKARRGAAQLL